MAASCSEVDVISRSSWGARPARQHEIPMMSRPASGVMFTHSYGYPCYDSGNCSRVTRVMQTYQMDTNGMPDISYNFLTGYDGSVLEGRGWTHKGLMNRTYIDAYSVAFIGKYPPSGNDLTKMSYKSALAANALIRCALTERFVNQNNYSVGTLWINPIMRNYILKPDLLPQSHVPSAHMASKSQAVRNAFIGGTILTILVGIFLIAFSCWLGKQRRQHYQHVSRAADYRKELLKTVPVEVVNQFLIPRRSVDLKNEQLGSGRHGHVFMGTLQLPDFRRASWSSTGTSGSVPVAVKMLRNIPVNGIATTAFLAEMAVWMNVGRHTNIVSLEGVVLQGTPMMIMEYCELRSLELYLHSVKTSPKTSQSDLPDDDANSIPVVAHELVSFVYQISRGMEFLSSKDIIHRDLAARNVLLDGQKVAKIADFGMAKEQPLYTLERDKVPLPVRWLAPECLQPNRAIFSTASDVWSFGVVVWEIYTLGAEPYTEEFPGGILYDQLCAFLHHGSRLNLPESCPNEIRQITLECWEFMPEARLSFSTIRRRVEAIVPMATKDLYVSYETES